MPAADAIPPGPPGPPNPTGAVPGPTGAALAADPARTLRAALWMLGAIVSFTSMAVAGREVSLELDTFEIMAYRSAIGVLLVVGVGWATGGLASVTRRHLGLHAARNIAHFTGQNLWFFALATIPLAQVFALEFTSPIWVTLMAPLFLGERLTPLKLVVVAAGFLGIVIVARPGVAPLDAGTVAALGAALGFATTAIFTKRLTGTQTVTCILFWLTTMQLVLGVACAGADGDIALPSAASLPWLVLIGCAGLAAHLCLTTALSLAPASVVMPMDFARLPVIAVIGMAAYAEPLDPLVFLGGAVIFGANYVNVISQRRRDARAG